MKILQKLKSWWLAYKQGQEIERLEREPARSRSGGRARGCDMWKPQENYRPQATGPSREEM